VHHKFHFIDIALVSFLAFFIVLQEIFPHVQEHPLDNNSSLPLVIHLSDDFGDGGMRISSLVVECVGRRVAIYIFL
jgi:hypothetical protein